MPCSLPVNIPSVFLGTGADRGDLLPVLTSSSLSVLSPESSEPNLPNFLHDLLPHAAQFLATNGR